MLQLSAFRFAFRLCHRTRDRHLFKLQLPPEFPTEEQQDEARLDNLGHHRQISHVPDLKTRSMREQDRRQRKEQQP